MNVVTYLTIVNLIGYNVKVYYMHIYCTVKGFRVISGNLLTNRIDRCMMRETEKEIQMLIHTPAPWKVSDDTDGVWVSGSDPNANVICDIVGRAYDHKTGEITITGEDIANANLIAAAPELLAALQAFVDYHATDYEDIPEMEQARAAIVKATGEVLENGNG
jgi:hypothetical protein